MRVRPFPRRRRFPRFPPGARRHNANRSSSSDGSARRCARRAHRAARPPGAAAAARPARARRGRRLDLLASDRRLRADRERSCRRKRAGHAAEGGDAAPSCAAAKKPQLLPQRRLCRTRVPSGAQPCKHIDEDVEYGRRGEAAAPLPERGGRGLRRRHHQGAPAPRRSRRAPTLDAPALPTQFKKLCRQIGIRRWPRRELRTQVARLARARPPDGRPQDGDAAAAAAAAAQSHAVWQAYATRVSDSLHAAADCADMM